MPQEPQERELLEASANNRDIRRRIDHLERSLAHVRIAQRRFREGTLRSSDALDQALAEGSSVLEGLRQRLGGHVQGRRRPVRAEGEDQPEVLVFVDECGSPRLHASADDLGAFALGAVLVPRSEYGRFEAVWREWKESTWGTQDTKIHEPNVRKGNGPFWFDGDRQRTRDARDSLGNTLAGLDFSAVVIVIRREAYTAEHGHQGINEILPEAPYLMALDFLSERLVFALNQDFSNGKGQLIAESRGPREDAQLQQEFARLHIDGTTYISASWFRSQLIPGIQFGRKDDLMAGLEVADLLCRPCAEKALEPSSAPERWPEFRAKICQGRETANSPVGIKVIPWSPEHNGFWQS